MPVFEVQNHFQNETARTDARCAAPGALPAWLFGFRRGGRLLLPHFAPEVIRSKAGQIFEAAAEMEFIRISQIAADVFNGPVECFEPMPGQVNLEVVHIGFGQGPGVWRIRFGEHSQERIRSEFRECYLLYLESKEEFAPGITGLLKVMLQRMVNELNLPERENALSRVFEPLRQQLNPPWKKLNLAELARMSGMSRATFFRRFREFYGCTPIQYRDNLLIFQAKHLLVYSALRITEIADQMGFPDQFYFCKFFRARTGCSPSRFRLRVRNRETAFGCDDGK